MKPRSLGGLVDALLCCFPLLVKEGLSSGDVFFFFFFSDALLAAFFRNKKKSKEEQWLWKPELLSGVACWEAGMSDRCRGCLACARAVWAPFFGGPFLAPLFGASWKTLGLFRQTTEAVMSLTSRDMWGVLRGSCREPLCDCQRYVVVCPSDESAAKIRCEFCNHCPSIHGRITDLGKWRFFLAEPLQ